MPLSSIWGRHRLTVAEVQLFAYDGPKTTEDRMAPPLGLIVRVRVNGDQGDASGLGESRVSHQNRDSAWSYLAHVADQFAGTQLQWRRRPQKALAAALNVYAPSSVYSPGEAQAFKALRQACDNALRAVLGRAPDTYETLRQRRPDEKWPTVVLNDSPPRIDLMNLFPRIDRFETYPQVEGPYRGEFNDYYEFLLPGAPIGVPSPYQMERAALGIGLSTSRFSPRHFVAHVGDESSPLGFRSLNSSDVSMACLKVGRDKATTKLLLEKANIPHPAGRDFRPQEVDKAEKQLRTSVTPWSLSQSAAIKAMGSPPTSRIPMSYALEFSEPSTLDLIRGTSLSKSKPPAPTTESWSPRKKP